MPYSPNPLLCVVGVGSEAKEVVGGLIQHTYILWYASHKITHFLLHHLHAYVLSMPVTNEILTPSPAINSGYQCYFSLHNTRMETRAKEKRWKITCKL